MLPFYIIDNLNYKGDKNEWNRFYDRVLCV